jgi:hypothetical protein
MLAEQVGALIENCNRQSYLIHNKALIHKWFANICNFLIIAGSATSGALAAYKDESLTSAIIIVSFSVAALKSLLIFYTPEKKALILETISIEISSLARKLRRLDTKDPNNEMVRKALDKAYERFDNYKIRLFGGDPSKEIEYLPDKGLVPEQKLDV